MAGQLSVASPGFYALGGYVAAILSTKVFHPAPGLYPVSLVLIEMALAAVVSGVLGIAVGLPALRLRGIFLALATIAFVQILGVVALNLDVTGGAIGIFGIPQPFGSQLQYMWLAIPLLLLSMLFVARLERTRTGRALIALREDELAAAAMGVDPTYHKVLAFTASAVLAGAVGAISAHFINTWNSRQGTFDTSVNLMAFVLVGGSRTFVGPVVGGLVLTALPEALRGVADGGGPRVVLRAARRALRPDRAQRRRQDDAVQPHHGPQRAHRRPAPVSGPRHHGPAAPPHRRPRHRAHVSERASVRRALGAPERDDRASRANDERPRGRRDRAALGARRGARDAAPGPGAARAGRPRRPSRRAGPQLRLRRPAPARDRARPGAGAGAAPARRARRRHEQRREAEPGRAHSWHSHAPRPHHPLDRAPRAARHGPLRSHRGAELRRAHRAGRARERPA